MGQKVYILEGRQFRTESDYACAMRDKEKIDKLRQETDFGSGEALKTLQKDIRRGRYNFLTILERDFLDEVEEQLKKLEASGREGGRGKRTGSAKGAGNSKKTAATGKKSSADGKPTGQAKEAYSAKNREAKRTGSAQAAKAGQEASSSGRTESALDETVQEELKRRERRRKLILILSGAAAICCLGYFVVYSYYTYRTESTYRELSELKDKAASATPAPSAPEAPSGPLYTLDEEPEEKEVLEEYRELLQRNRKLIGWIKIEGTNIDYPVMQTTDNEYYLNHNLNQEYDQNGTIFMDKDCDVLKPSTNYILYGHHMLNGKMFGQLDQYLKESFYEEHPYISFDTIYEKGTYQVMYVFRAKVYKETEIAFKYYQFIDANGATEFDSYMQEMAEMSVYDTGVTAQYGDQLLTLSTCNEKEEDGRYVVVAKKIE